MVSQINLALFGSGYWGTKLAGEYLQLQKDNKNFKNTKNNIVNMLQNLFAF